MRNSGRVWKPWEVTGKKLYWYSTFGTIALFEQVFLEAGHLVHPFSQAVGVTCRGYSLPLQRRMTDLGADVPFGKVSEKLLEPYGISVSTSSARMITEDHAQTIREQEQAYLRSAIPEHAGRACLIAETDGTMIPILKPVNSETEAEPLDKRKVRKGCWKEARLTLTHPQGSVSPVFGGTIGSPDEVELSYSIVPFGRGWDKPPRFTMLAMGRRGLPIR